MSDAASSSAGTLMEAEALEAPDAVARMLAANQDRFAQIAARLRADPPAVAVTCARGSSDHAATYAKYLIETLTGTPTASAAPSVASIYGASPRAPCSRLCLAISQSGRSPDLLAAVERQRDAGAFVVALVNAEDTPLAALADAVIALSAGSERAVAATKSCLASLAAIAALVAVWSEDAVLGGALERLPDDLRAASGLDWSAAIQPLRDAPNLFVLGRGYGLGIAQEMALKLKETCELHAEAYSAAEVRHGPMAIVGEGFPVLALGGGDPAAVSVREVADEFRARGAAVLLADPAHADLPMLAAHPALEPLLALQSFYLFASRLALGRGLNPDAPPHLTKVTKTV
ncbi:MAG TPA: SIS domain-containing protein [Qipengyuania sp.]|nr:SIS domain-containing protein [Qipengyuania sp.]